MAQLNILVGQQGCGKSTFLKKLADSIWVDAQRRTLIIDPGEASAYASYPFIKVEEIPGFRNANDGAIKRISSVINKKRLIAVIFGFDFEANDIDKSRAFLNGNLFMEDAASYINSSMTEQLLEAIKSFKQNGLTLVLCYHSISEISSQVLDLAPHHIFVKKTNDDNVFSRIRKARKLGNYHELMKAFYTAKFKGLDGKDIAQIIPPDDLIQIGKDLDLAAKHGAMPDKDLTPEDRVTIGSMLCEFANGKKKLSTDAKAKGKYHTEYVHLRD